MPLIFINEKRYTLEINILFPILPYPFQRFLPGKFLCDAFYFLDRISFADSQFLKKSDSLNRAKLFVQDRNPPFQQCSLHFIQIQMDALSSL